MNFPFELILIVLFFVLPALGGILQRLRGQQPPPEEQPSRRPSPNQAPNRADTSTANPGETSADTNVPRWLEEAQRRVREAQQDEPSRRDGRSQPQTPRKPAARPLVSQQPARPQNSSRPVQTSLEDYRPKAVSLETTPIRDSARKQGPARSSAPPLRVQRVGRAKGATLGAYEMRFDQPTLMTGFVWHQILSPPLSQSRRTRLSRRQP